jgi:hypothetical protein
MEERLARTAIEKNLNSVWHSMKLGKLNAIRIGETRKTVPRLRLPSISQARKELPLAMVVAPEENINWF